MNTSILDAIHKGDLEVLYTLEKKLILDKFHYFFEACSTNNPSVVLYFISIFGKTIINSIDIKGNTPLHIACFIGTIKIARILYFNGANINTLNIDYHTPLMVSIIKGHLNIIQWLLPIRHGLNKPHDYPLLERIASKSGYIHVQNDIYLSKISELLG